MDALHHWRMKIADRDFKNTLFTGSGILSDDLIDLLSSLGPIDTKERLQQLLEGKWLWLERYQDELLELLTSLNLPPMVPKPKKPRNAPANIESQSAEEDPDVGVTQELQDGEHAERQTERGEKRGRDNVGVTQDASGGQEATSRNLRTPDLPR